MSAAVLRLTAPSPGVLAVGIAVVWPRLGRVAGCWAPPSLVITSAKRTTWDFSLLDRFGETSSYPVYLGIRAFQIVVVGLLSTWVSERWVLRDAEACSADSVSMMAGWLLYSFKDRLGEYYGGEGFPFSFVRLWVAFWFGYAVQNG